MHYYTLTPQDLGIAGNGKVFRNLPVTRLFEASLDRREGVLTETGALNVITGKYTGRSPNDKFFVDTKGVHDEIAWGEVNRPISKARYDAIKGKILAYLQNRDLYVFDGFGGADPKYTRSFRIVNEMASQSLFMHQMLIRPTKEEIESFVPDYTLYVAPGFQCNPKQDGIHSEAAILVNLEEKEVLIAGSQYSGEIKKAVFTIMNYVLPKAGILSMHCSANLGKNGDTAVFFGLSGTGKTTLSADPDRGLIGDDEHGWSDRGVFNIEGGCYAKCIGLKEELEPEIFRAIRFGSLLENVVLTPSGHPDYMDGSLTENTRATYPVDYIPSAVIPGVGGQPSTVIFLTADAFGVLPPIARLDKNAAMYHFVSGYTSKLAGTERGITRPVTTFSTLFGEPFFPLRASVYAEMLGKKLDETGANVFLVNTGWCGGHAGTIPRIKLKFTRAMVSAAINGKLDNVEYVHDPIFNLDIPASVPGVPSKILIPRAVWADEEDYLEAAHELAREFRENFDKKYPDMPDYIKAAGPQLD